MGLNKSMVMVKVALIFFLLGISTANARLDRRTIAAAQRPLMSSFGLASESSISDEACCDNCQCGGTDPYQCLCFDWKETCYKGCRSCFCQPIIPPRCRCFDFRVTCLPTCSSSRKAET